MALRSVADNGFTYVLARRDPWPRWAESLVRFPAVRWRMGDEEHAGRAEFVDDPTDASRILSEMTLAVGAERIHRWFGPEPLRIRLRSEPAAGLAYPSRVEAYFDGLAAGYESSVSGNWLDRDLRRVTGAFLASAFEPGERVLEIGCGTGLETLPLARRGVDVVAIDISAAMLRILERKASAEGIGPRISLRHLAARDLRALLSEFGPGSFQGVFSTFGALNCEDGLADLPSVLRDLVEPGGRAVFAVWNRACLFEMGAYAATLHPRRALARLQRPVPVGLSRFGVPAYPYSVAEFAHAFRSAFRVERVMALPLFLPPYDFAGRAPQHGGLAALLETLDRSLRGRYPFNRLGDHFLMEMGRMA